MFSDFSKVVLARYNEMAKGELFIVDLPESFAKYLAAFPAGSDPIRKTRTEHDCQCCKQFIRNIGKLVAFDADNNIMSVWDDPEGKLTGPYKVVAQRMAHLVRTAVIKSVFRTKERQYGKEYNYGPDDVRYEHFHGKVADRHYSADKADTLRGEKDGIFQVMYRGLMEFKDEHFEAVLEKIEENVLYKGQEFKSSIVAFRELLRNFNTLRVDSETDSINNQRNFVWANLDNRNAKFRGSAIGQLFVQLAEGKDLDSAMKSYEAMVAPGNYQRPTATITQKMVEKAQQELTDSGLGPAIYRRFARLDDVSVTDVLFVDNASRSKMKDGGIMDLLAGEVKTSTPDLKHAIPIKAEDFVKDIVPGSKTLSVLVENRHAGNFVSLTAPKDDGNYQLFKWRNNFAWCYDGDVTASVKARVKAAGGKIDCKLRVSLSWFNTDDLDLHCQAPDLGHIYFGAKAGILDVDKNAGDVVRNPVENLAFDTLHDGVYQVYVNQWCRRETIDVGFAIEIEYGGIINQYSYPKSLKTAENVPCFDFTIKNGQLLKIDAKLEGGNVSKEKWSVKTETLVPVVALMNSPNHWGDNQSGAKHLIFALQGCVNPDSIRGIFNEYLRPELHQHRKVFEVLGAKTKCPPTNDQISGLGFTSARGDSVTVVVDGRKSYTLAF